MKTTTDWRAEYQKIRETALELAGNGLNEAEFDIHARNAIESMELDFTPPSWVCAAESVLSDVQLQEALECEEWIMWREEKGL